MKFDDPWQSILDFWFGDSLEAGWPVTSRNHIWFAGGEGLDEEIRVRFSGLVEAALQHGLVEWEGSPEGRLALIVLLDQFTRNVYRGQEKAFSGDHRAATLVIEGIARNLDQQLPVIGQVFFYMPLMHIEDLDLQQQCVDQFENLYASAPDRIRNELQANLDFAREHYQVIERFGRFPHRNQVLGRESTEEEIRFLEHASRYGQ